NVKLIWAANQGYDYGGYGVALSSMELSYDYFVFVNSSVLGPFGCSAETWIERFLSPLKGDVRLSGATINFLAAESPHHANFSARYPEFEAPFSHGQSFGFCIGPGHAALFAKLRHVRCTCFQAKVRCDPGFRAEDVAAREAPRLEHIVRRAWLP